MFKIGTSIILKKEFIDAIISPKFWIIFFIFSLMIFISSYEGVQNYNNQMINYQKALALQESAKDKVPPNFFTLSVPKPSFLGTFGPVIDSITIIGALLGLILGYNAISDERKSGSLNVLLSYPIYRDSIINGKFFGNLFILIVASFFAIFISSGIIIGLLDITPTINDIIRLFFVFIFSIIYMTVFLNIGILFSIVLKDSSFSLFLSIVAWLLSVFLVGKLAFIIANTIAPLPTNNFYSGPSLSDAQIYHFNTLNLINRISPGYNYQEFASYMLYPTKTTAGSIFILKLSEHPLNIMQSLTHAWTDISLLLGLLVILFVASYILFMRQDIR